MIKRLDVLFLLLLFCTALSAAELSDKKPAKVDTVESIRRSLRGIEAVCDYSMQKNIPLPMRETGEESLSEKMKNANFYFEKGDYAASADLFYSIVALHSENDEMRHTALLRLAESLYKQKNYISAIKYYETLLEAGIKPTYKSFTLQRLIASRYYLGDYAGVKKSYDSFVKAGYGVESDQEILYYLGKSLFYDNRFSEAVNVFYSIKKEAAFYPQSRYFLGILSIKEHEYDDALSFYEEIVRLEEVGRYNNYSKIRELSILAAARILFEAGKFDRAADYYLLTDKKSGSFARAYYELGWVYIKTEKYMQAVNTLRTIRLLAPQSDVVPEAEALEGTLLVQLKQYDAALELFDSMVKKYGRVQNDLFNIDGKIFMLNGHPRKVADFLLPYSPVVKSLLKDTRKFVNAKDLNDSILRIDAELKQLESREHKLSAMIANKNIAAAYPTLSTSAKQVLFLRDRVAAIKNALAVMRKNAIGNDILWDQLRDFDDIDAKKCELLGVSEVKSINPAKIRERAEEYSKRVKRDGDDMRRIFKQLALMSKDLEDVISLYASEQNVPEEKAKKFMDMVVSEREALRDMMLESDSYRSELDVEYAEMAVGGHIEVRENAIRKLLNDWTDRQYAILGDDESSEIHVLMDEADRIDRKLADYYGTLNSTLKELVDTMRVSYEKEKGEIDAYRSEFAGLRREFEEMAVLAMYSSLNNVKTAVSGYMLHGDLGLVDVMWEKKEDDSAEILRLKTQKAQEIQQLYINLDGEQ